MNIFELTQDLKIILCKKKKEMDCYGTKLKTSFIMEEMPIITSSPIEGKLIENSPFNQNLENLPTWATLLKDYRGKQVKKSCNKNLTPKKDSIFSNPTNISNDNSSSHFEPIAEHMMRVTLTPNHKIRVISSSARKIYSHHNTPKKPNKIRQNNNETVRFIQEVLKSNKKLTVDEINLYETILKHHINPQQPLKKNDSLTELPDCGLWNLIEDEIGGLKLSPTSSRILKIRKQEQEKRLVSLAIAKRKSSSEIKKQISKQQIVAQEQVFILFHEYGSATCSYIISKN